MSGSGNLNRATNNPVHIANKYYIEKYFEQAK